MSLATVDDLQRILRNEAGRFSVGSDQKDNMTTADAESYLADALNILRIKYQDQIDIDGLSSGTWVRTVLIRMQCYLTIKILNTTTTEDMTPIDKAIDDLHRMLFKRQNKASSVMCGVFRP